MDHRAAFTRRQFLHSSLAMVSMVGTVPTFLSRSASVLAADTTMRLSSQPGVPDDRVLVVVQLSGGNDGLNTVVPYGMGRGYYDARPGIAVPANQALPLDTNLGIGLHPALADVRDMVGEGLAAVVQGVGYPNPNRSHFASMDVWHTGDTRGENRRGVGWIGRALDRSLAGKDGRPAPDAHLACVCLGSEAPLATQGKHIKPVAFDRAELFRWSGRDLHPALSDAYDALHEGPPDDAAAADDPRAFVFRTACDAQVASDRVRQAVAQRSQTPFPGSPLGRQLETVAAMIRADLPTRVYYAAMGGFDTHANQAGQHARLLGEFGQAMRAFYAELGASGDRGRVVTLAFSEFGRRVSQNASGGTDHGAAGPAFVFGESVQAGLRGRHPSLTELDQGDLVYTTDFRSVYADVLGRWMKMDPEAAVGRAYPPAGVVGV